MSSTSTMPLNTPIVLQRLPREENTHSTRDLLRGIDQRTHRSFRRISHSPRASLHHRPQTLQRNNNSLTEALRLDATIGHLQRKCHHEELQRDKSFLQTSKAIDGTTLHADHQTLQRAKNILTGNSQITWQTTRRETNQPGRQTSSRVSTHSATSKRTQRNNTLFFVFFFFFSIRLDSLSSRSMKKLNIRQFGVGSLMRSAPIISADSKYLFTIGESCVYLWFVHSGELSRSLNRLSHSTSKNNRGEGKGEQTIVSIALNPHNRLQLCVALNNGRINIWDYEDSILIHTIELELEIVQINSIVNRCLYLFTKSPNNVCSLHRIDSIRHYSSLVLVFEKLPCFPHSISFDEKGDYCLLINVEGTVVCLLQLLTSQVKLFPLSKGNLSVHEKITCAQLHPREESFALGTQSGRIALWFDFLRGTSKDVTISYLHWHSLPVLSLAFSPDGCYLYSGGHECVLVKWLYRTSEPTFLPRLGAPIIHLNSANDQTFLLSTHSNNTLHVISSHLSITQTIAGMNEMFLPNQSSLPAGIHLFRRERAILMNSGQPGHLQFVSIEQGKLIYNLDLLGENYVSGNEMNSQCLYTDIKRLKIDSTENWLVTFEERSSIKGNPERSDDEHNERRLRFWNFNSLTHQFELNTTITYPHGQETLNEMLFHPQRCQLATTGNDGFMKIWILIKDNPLTKRRCHWECQLALSDRSCASGSLCYYSLNNEWNICCSFEHLIQIWRDRSSGEEDDECRYQSLRCLSHFDREDFVRSLNVCSLTLLVSHHRLVNLWNVHSGEFLRSLPWHVHTIVQHPQHNLIAAFDRNFLHLYSFVDGRCHSRKNSLFRRVTAAIFIPNDKASPSSSLLENSRLVFAIPDQGLKTLGDEEEEEEEGEGEKKMSPQSNDLLGQLIVQSRKEFQSMFPSTKKPSVNEIPTKSTFNGQLLSTPSYLLPSIAQYSLQSLKQMLQPNVLLDSSEQIDSL